MEIKSQVSGEMPFLIKLHLAIASKIILIRIKSLNSEKPKNVILTLNNEISYKTKLPEMKNNY